VKVEVLHLMLIDSNVHEQFYQKVNWS